MEWIKARLKEKSTQRSIPLFIGGLVAVAYAIYNHEPSASIVGAVVSLYGVMNAVTPEKS
ncbi:MAG: hypothetical protein HGA87_00465 [Desulfobulbaceae bacterium]|nr:hypothetical protein [Desulfobulbaceae bacterium]